jgi:hypothetical protein
LVFPHTHTEKEVKKKKDISTPDSVESLFSPFLAPLNSPSVQIAKLSR